MAKPLIAVTMGDPCGIGPEIIAKALADSEVSAACRPVVIGDIAAMDRGVATAGTSQRIEAVTVGGLADLEFGQALHVLQAGVITSADMVYGRPTSQTGQAVYEYIKAAASLCMSGAVAAMATAPISKEVLNRAGHHYPGHTELLADLTSTDDYIMMLAGDRLRVSLVTIHEAISAVPSMLTVERVLKTIRITSSGVARHFRTDPKIAVLALNPHCGEGGLFGSEESTIISPAIELARSEGIDAHGPLSADTLFHFAAAGEYDAVVCMYHDQGLIPLKLLHFDDGVNITLGLPIIRTSVDHGTAYGIAGNGVASAASMKAAILTAARMAQSGNGNNTARG